jgi:hypothetical protein
MRSISYTPMPIDSLDLANLDVDAGFVWGDSEPLGAPDLAEQRYGGRAGRGAGDSAIIWATGGQLDLSRFATMMVPPPTPVIVQKPARAHVQCRPHRPPPPRTTSRRNRRASAHLVLRGSVARLSLILCNAVLLLIQAGCGEGRPSNTHRAPSSPQAPLPVSVVAQVGTKSITKAMLGHWITLDGVLSSGLTPGRPVPRGLVPDPPAFTACVAYLASHANKSARKADATQFKSACAERARNLRPQALRLLVISEWLGDEANRRGIRVSDVEIQRATKGPYRQRHLLLMEAGASRADQRFFIGSELLGAKLRRTLPIYARLREQTRRGIVETAQMSAEVDAELQKFNDALTTRWAHLTRCASAYAIPECGVTAPTAREAAPANGRGVLK